jgi:S-DNA-T family DNA segregation ATPase FtsK/SpoIIIE
LNKDNSTARLLSRPGEAIYNDANGAIEGNEVFQVVWLPEEEREQIIDQVRQRAIRELPEIASRPALVFEGNTPADLDRNPLLRRLLQPAESAMGHEIQDPHSPFAIPHSSFGKAWLGEAIAIKDPTAAVFRPQTSDNLLIVGQNDEAALALLASALVSLAVQQPSAHFVVLDGTAPHQPHAGYLKAVMEGWPQPMVLADRAGLSAALAGMAEEMNHRLKGDGSDRSVRYLLINGLQAYREFRRGDDDLGLGRRGADRTVSPLEHLQSLLRDGPGVGIHVLIWCDSLVNVMRSLDRAGLRECGQRVLFQMSAADSSHLLDSPLASRLGRNRALYYTDELGQPEKFRPYGLPSLAWLAEVKRQCTATLASPL